MARHGDVAGPPPPQRPDCVDRRLADGGVVGHVGRARNELGAVLGGVAGEDYVALGRVQHEDQMTGRVAGREMRGDAGKHFLALGRGMQRRPAVELAHIKLGHRRFAPRHFQRPRQLAGADHDARVGKHRPIHGMIVMRVGEQQIGDVSRLQSALSEALDQHGAHAEPAGIDQRDAAMRAQQNHRAPAQAAMADRFAGKALHDDVDVVVVYFHVVFDA